MGRGGLGVLASAVADVWSSKTDVCRSALRLLAIASMEARAEDVPLDRPLGKVPPGYLRSLCPASTCSSFQSTRTSIASSFVDHAPPRGCVREPRLSTIQERSRNEAWRVKPQEPQMSSVQDPCWLMISSGMLLPNIIHEDYNNPIGEYL
eukprot:s557_g7.t1